MVRAERTPTEAEIKRAVFLKEQCRWTFSRIAREMDMPRFEVRRICWTHTNRPIHWTAPLSAQERERVYQLREEGATWRQIAEELGTSLYRVRCACGDIRAWGRQTPRQIAEVVRLRDEERLTWAEIGERVDVDEHTALRIYRRAHESEGGENG